MSRDAPLPQVRVKVPCSSEGVFLRELAPRLTGRFWVPSEVSASTGDSVALVVELEGTSRTLGGTARVTEAAPMKLCLRLIALEDGGVQFALGGDGSGRPDDVLMPGVWHERPHPFTEAPTPPFGVKLTPPPAGARVMTPAPAGSWSGGLRPLDTLGNYQLLERLGRGGMAEVYVARALIGGGVEKLVALKLTLPEYGPGTPHGGLFLDEARICASLQHKGLVQVFEFGEASGRPYLTMEYVRGRDLATLARAQRTKQLPQWRAFALSVVREMALALEYLHGRADPSGEYLRLVHRDISPGNVLVSEFGEVKIIDFGVASIRAPEGGIVAGKPGYMPPEQAEGKPPNPGWDLFAAGVVLKELLSGLDESAAAARATHADPDQRFLSARQLHDALSAELTAAGPVDAGAVVKALCGDVLSDEQRRVGEVTLKARAARPASRRRPPSRRALAAAATLAVIAAVLGVSSLMRASALNAELERLDERMRAGALSGPGETALTALAAAREQGADDARVKARAAELARVFELLGTTAAKRGNTGEALAHWESLAVAAPGRADVLEKLLRAPSPP